MLRIFLAIIMILAWVVPALAETSIVELQHRRAVEVAEAVRAVLGDEVKVNAVDHSLVIHGEPSQLAAAAELIAHLDHPPRMLRVFVAQDRESAQQGSAVDGSGSVTVGSATVTVGHPDAPPHAGATVQTGDGNRLQVGTEAFSRLETRSVEQFVVTLEGEAARISVGRRIPVTERWLNLARRHHPQVLTSMHYESLETGFAVQPELFGEMVQLSIQPFMAFQDPRQMQEIVFQELTTRVTIRLGQWFDLGGSMAGQDEVSREILAAGRQTGTTSSSIRVRVELQPN